MREHEKEEYCKEEGIKCLKKYYKRKLVLCIAVGMPIGIVAHIMLALVLWLLNTEDFFYYGFGATIVSFCVTYFTQGYITLCTYKKLRQLQTTTEKTD